MSVAIPRSQTVDPDDRGTPLTVGAASLAFMAPVKYYDNSGQPHMEFVFVVGDTVYKDPAGESWAAKLKVLNDGLAQEIVQRTKGQMHDVIRKALQEMGITPGSVSQDEVDVIADETDEDVSAS
jgi:hypothetical protein